MKYKVGDKVRVRQWKAMERQYDTDILGIIKTPGYKFKGSGYCGKIATITGVYKNYDYYRVDIDNGSDCWTDDMFEGYAFEYGDWIEVSDNKIHWEKVMYVSYIDGTKYPYVIAMRGIPAKHFKAGEVFGCESYIHARPIQAQEKHKIIIDNKEIEISKESYDNLKKALKEM